MANVAQIPVIDISGSDRAMVASELVDAAVNHGFVYLRNNGNDIDLEAIANTFEIASSSKTKKLFASPKEEKEQFRMRPGMHRGYAGMQAETLDPKNQRVGDYKEVFNICEFIDGKAQQPLPPVLAQQEDDLANFYELCYNTLLKLTELLGIGLGVDPPTFFKSVHLREQGSSDNTLRLLYYPPLSTTDAQPSVDVRAGAHSDYGSLTLLFRLAGQPGLEILTSDSPDGELTWKPVPVTPPGTENDPAPPILMNIGDLLSYWTNGLLRSTVHRVVFPAGGEAGERYSVAFFGHPVGSSEIGAVPSERVRAFRPRGETGNPYAERKAITADEHLKMRLQATYLGLYGTGKGDGTGEKE